MLSELELIVTLIKAHRDRSIRDERGEAVSWLLVIIAAIAITGVVVLAVKTYVEGQTTKLK